MNETDKEGRIPKKFKTSWGVEYVVWVEKDRVKKKDENKSYTIEQLKKSK